MSVETLPDRARTATPADRRCFTVVAAGQTYGLPVEYIQTVFEITAITLDKGTSIEAPPHIGTEGVAVEAMYRLEEMILPVLDLDWIFALSGKE